MHTVLVAFGLIAVAGVALAILFVVFFLVMLALAWRDGPISSTFEGVTYPPTKPYRWADLRKDARAIYSKATQDRETARSTASSIALTIVAVFGAAYATAWFFRL